MQVNPKVAFNKSIVEAKIKAAGTEAVETLAEQVLSDSNQYCPEDQGILVRSSETASDFKKGILKWVAPYARYLWYGLVMHGTPKNRDYGPEEMKFTKSKARKMWAHYAKTVHEKDWKLIFQKALRSVMRK